MYICDYHVHTEFSFDCDTPVEEVIKKGISMGLNEMAFTDHVEYDIELIDFDKYLKMYNEMKNKYKDKIDILLGAEIGFQHHVIDDIEKLIDKYPFDFTILSTHTVDRLDICNGDFFKDKDLKNAYLRYFENMLESIEKFKNYSILGHLDFISRYTRDDQKLLYSDYIDIIDSILTKAIDNDCGIEVNTSGYRYGLDSVHPQVDILKRYNELGGQIITVGSDAHKSKDICADFDIAYDILKNIGFKKITTFKQRKPEFKNIP
ncbi:histidinol-phosphatase HisJ family protein [Tepidibacter sp. Z1-5]|uniref:histidinol-phosphatase HisJ family protein n=1 Tax=Tepidibacter sp. Z1-5 TaxID=3134138 RepID=UPI0030C63970